jgi:hypothetical protein
MYTGLRKDSVDREDREAPPCQGWSVEAVKTLHRLQKTNRAGGRFVQ